MDRVQHRKITRNRELRACTECRKRKLKCDRQLPCSSCARRDEAASCVYEKKFEGPQSERERRLRAEARLEHLETLVRELSQSQQDSTVYSTTDAGPSTTQLGGNEISVDPTYRGATHWSAMLEDIEVLRSAIGESEDIDSPDTDPESFDFDRVSILFGSANTMSLQQLLNLSLPLRQEADRLVAAYFRARAAAAPFIHGAQFMRQYRRFWNDPSAASPLWTSILFSILDIASRTMPSKLKTSSTDPSVKDTQFSAAAAHCLSIGKYHRPQPFAVESLLLYVQARCIASVDIPPDLGVLLGTLIRLATTMGYHRDADVCKPAMPAFEKEMRRRTWSLCMQLDLLVSFQLGLPSNVQFPTWDARPPSNLQDSDFDEDTVELPMARPDSERTELSFYIAKHKLMTVFEKILRHSLSFADQPIEELNAIDQELRATYASLPAVFMARPMTASVVDPASVIVTRLCVNFIYQKCLCALHRKYVPSGRAESIQVCFDSASDLIKRFLDIWKEFEPGGQLESERWFMGSISWHDFLLGCTALSLTLFSAQNFAAGLSSSPTVDIEGALHLLQSTKALLSENQLANSKDTRKVARLVEATILKFKDQAPSYIGPGNVVSDPPWQAMPLSQGGGDSGSQWGESTMWPVEDPMWAYMGQFLDLPSEDFMSDNGA